MLKILKFIFKRKVKGPRLTELHKEVAQLRQKLDASSRLNDYLTKQIEIFHITQGNIDSLLEMAQKLNLTKEELDQYKEKLSRIQDISESLPTNRRSQIPISVNQSKG